jgi:hypothetical protein
MRINNSDPCPFFSSIEIVLSYFLCGGNRKTCYCCCPHIVYSVLFEIVVLNIYKTVIATKEIPKFTSCQIESWRYPDIAYVIRESIQIKQGVSPLCIKSICFSKKIFVNGLTTASVGTFQMCIKFLILIYLASPIGHLYINIYSTLISNISTAEGRKKWIENGFVGL